MFKDMAKTWQNGSMERAKSIWGQKKPESLLTFLKVVTLWVLNGTISHIEAMLMYYLPCSHTTKRVTILPLSCFVSTSPDGTGWDTDLSQWFTSDNMVINGDDGFIIWQAFRRTAFCLGKLHCWTNVRKLWWLYLPFSPSFAPVSGPKLEDSEPGVQKQLRERHHVPQFCGHSNTVLSFNQWHS